MQNTPDKHAGNAVTPIRVICENCGTDLFADETDAGKTATCPECGVKLTIPSSRKGDTPSASSTPSIAPKDKKELGSDVSPDVEVIPPSEGIPLDFPQDEADEPSAQRPPAEAHRPPPDPEAEARAHEARAKLAGWLRRTVIVILAFTVLLIFEAASTAVNGSPPTSLHAILTSLREAVFAVPFNLHVLTEIRPVEIGALVPIERFALGLVMLLFAARLVVRTKLLDAIYVTTPRWAERTNSGLVFHSLALLLQAGILAWAASTVKTPTASDGLACGLLGLFLLVSGVWLCILHLITSHEHRDLLSWMIADAAFGLLVILVVWLPGLTLLWSRAGATVVLCLANSTIALHLGASFVFERRPRGWWWRKPLFLAVSAVVVLSTALLLAYIR